MKEQTKQTKEQHSDGLRQLNLKRNKSTIVHKVDKEKKKPKENKKQKKQGNCDFNLRHCQDN